MDITRDVYEKRMKFISELDLGQAGLAITEVLSVFPHDKMTFTKAKAEKEAYKGCEVIWKMHPPVIDAYNAIENTLYLALNEVFVKTLPKEVAQLQYAVEKLREVHTAYKSNQNIVGYVKSLPTVLLKPKDLGKIFVSTVEQVGKDLGINFDREILFNIYKEKYQEVLVEEKKKCQNSK